MILKGWAFKLLDICSFVSKLRMTAGVSGRQVLLWLLQADWLSSCWPEVITLVNNPFRLPVMMSFMLVSLTSI